MNQLQKNNNKRIVSKGTYIANLGAKAVVASYGSVVFLLGFLCTLFTCGLGILMLMSLGGPAALTAIVAAGIGLLGSCSFALLHYGAKAIKEAKETEVGTPLTRANTADLPAVDSLVRASSESLQAQETVLLRAAAETQEQQEEELLRASTRGQE